MKRYASGDRVSQAVTRYAQARWSSFPNMYWEISNDMILIPDGTEPGYWRDMYPGPIDKIGLDMAEREPWGT